MTRSWKLLLTTKQVLCTCAGLPTGCAHPQGVAGGGRRRPSPRGTAGAFRQSGASSCMGSLHCHLSWALNRWIGNRETPPSSEDGAWEQDSYYKVILDFSLCIVVFMFLRTLWDIQVWEIINNVFYLHGFPKLWQACYCTLKLQSYLLPEANK